MSRRLTLIGRFVAVETRGLFFGQDSTCSSDSCGWANLLPELLLSPATVGTTVSADASSGADFARAAGFLTDGRDGFVAIGHASAGGPFATYSAFAEPTLGAGSVDLAGLVIERISFRLDDLLLDSPGSDPNHDGMWTDYEYRATLIVEGVPEAPPIWLVAAGLSGLALRRRAARTA